MAYDKHTWTCDEPITVERLNHIEDGIANAGGDCDCGYECTETRTTLTEESVTTTADSNFNTGTLSYPQFIDADSITVTFDGVEYECPRTDDGDYGAQWDDSIGAMDWSNFPFQINPTRDPITGNAINEVVTETAGTYTVKIEGMKEVVATTPCFKAAVKSAIDTRERVVSHMTETYDSSTGCVTFMLDITDEQLASIITSGLDLVIVNDVDNFVHYPLAIWASDASPHTRVTTPTARIIIAMVEGSSYELFELGSDTSQATPRYLTGKYCPSANQS